MTALPPSQASRREFLKRASALSVAGSAAPWALSLAAMGEAAAADATGYKALVCVFMYGGNDYANTVIPYDAPNWQAYKNQRSALAIDRLKLFDPTLGLNTVLAPTVPLPQGRRYALAPTLNQLWPSFDAGQLAVMLNIGTLRRITSKTDYANKYMLPPKLFSHNDQQSVWQSSLPEGATSGWGGRIGDLFASSNGKSTFTCVSVAGNAVYLTGQDGAVQYQVSPSGSVQLAGLGAPLFGSTACSEALRNLVTAPRTHLYEAEHTRVMARSISADRDLRGALPELATVFPATSLGGQLKMVAKMIAARNALQQKRQVFFVSLGGFDTHDNLLAEHPGLLQTVGDAMAAFQKAMNDELQVADSVTTFTASDFGRTLTTDGDGSDHGWGGMHFVLGGAVKGKAFYGTPPEVASGGANDVGQGRLLPGISVDQLGATLATWFGVAPGELKTVLPNLENYDEGVRNLGFMRT